MKLRFTNAATTGLVRRRQSRSRGQHAGRRELVAEADRTEAEAALQASRRGRSRSRGGFGGSRGFSSRGGAAAATASRSDRTTALNRAAAGVAAAAVTAVVAVVTTTAATAAIVDRTAAGRGAAAIAAGAARAGATIAAVTGHDLVLTAHQGDADDREEDRDAKQQCTIHPKFLQQNRYRTVRDLNQRPSLPNLFPPRDGRRKGGTFGQVLCTQLRRGCPVSSLLRLRFWTQMHRLG